LPVPEKNDRETGESVEELAARIVVHSPVPPEQPPCNWNSIRLSGTAQIFRTIAISWDGCISWVSSVRHRQSRDTQLGAVFIDGADHNTHMSKRTSAAHRFQTQTLIAAQVVLFGMVIFFFYITLAVLNDKPFWRTLGWQKLGKSWSPSQSMLYFIAGVALSLGVAGATTHEAA